MTLHWWMHWFWVTLLTFIVCANTVHAAPQSEELQHMTTDMESIKAERQARAMYFTKNPTTVTPTTITTTEKATVLNTTKANNETTTTVTHELRNETILNTTEATTTVSAMANVTAKSEATNATIHLVNDTETQPITKKRNNLTRHPEDTKLPDTIIESRIVTEKPLSLETTYLHTRVPDTIESSRRVIGTDRGMDSGAIAGISFGTLVLAALVGSTAFVLYRRRYLNKPQTLNDKCSNPDSSGYLDDSTIRDNSEEMYSLDNDSFLNSLEAMTIQNYWTDTVKHTKL